MDFVGKAKWDAWKTIEGTEKEEAQRRYHELVQEIGLSSQLSWTES